MSKTLHVLSLAALLATGSAAATFADDSSGASDTQKMTGTMTGSQQVGRPATDDTITTRQGQYSTKPVAPTAKSAQSSGHPYPGVVGPTGSTQSDATNPNRSPPGGDGSASSGSGGSNTR